MKRLTFIPIVLGIVALMVTVFGIAWALRPGPVAYGVTFSTKYAQSLHDDWRAMYLATLDDLGVQRVRIPVYWDDVERSDDVFEVSHLDWMMDEAAQRGVDVTLAVGLKVPRWPECYVPHWLSVDDAEFETQLMMYVRAIVERYREHPALVRWQVENEPLFLFGECPPPDTDRLARQVALVRSMDADHPILLTGSGEQALWVELAGLADEIGVSLYRFTVVPTLGPFVFPHTPFSYLVHARIAGLFVDRVLVSELQMEPWTTDGVTVAFTADAFWRHIEYVEQTGIGEVWLWGVEWWYAQAQRGDASLWHAARQLFAH